MIRVGIIGGGQLAQMLALAGYALGIKCVCLESTLSCPAGLVTDVIVGNYNDPDKLQELAAQVDIITYEFENIDWQSVSHTIKDKIIYPPLTALEFSQDRLTEKTFFNQLNIPTARFKDINSLAELQTAAQEIGLPLILKTRRFGYDGKGQYFIKDANDLDNAWQQLQGQVLIAEQVIKFEREVSLIAVRAINGSVVYYPLIENQHRNGILRVSRAPYSNIQLQQQAEQYAQAVLEKLNYVGVLTIEFFQCGAQLLANEMAPRVHNSGHWTIEGAVTSQFENHLRAILDLPLGATNAVGYSGMVNLIGIMPAHEKILQIPAAHLHDYGKEARPNRKLGHVTLCANNENDLQKDVLDLMNLLI